MKNLRLKAKPFPITPKYSICSTDETTMNNLFLLFTLPLYKDFEVTHREQHVFFSSAT